MVDDHCSVESHYHEDPHGHCSACLSAFCAYHYYEHNKYCPRKPEFIQEALKSDEVANVGRTHREGE